MIPILAFIAGFALGWRRAARRGGGRADKWQYAFAHAVIFAVAAFAVSLILLNLGLLPAAPFG